MPHDYTKLQAKFRKHKAALTRAKNSKDPDKIIAACDAFFADFGDDPLPDNWSLWQRAKDDAEHEKEMAKPSSLFNTL